MSRLSIVVVSYNTREATLACLRSARADDPDAELVVVDNGSVDGTVEAIRDSLPAATVIAAGENLGFARGVNRGARAAGGERILLLNPDALVLPGTLAALTGFADAHPEYRLYGGRTVRPDGELDPSSCWGEPSWWSLVCFATGLSTAFPRTRAFDPESLGSWRRDCVREVPIITGCLLLVSRSDWEALGGMDEDYFLYGEDADFSRRARAAGLRPVVVPDAVIVHEVGGSTASAGRKMCMVMAGKATDARKHRGRIGAAAAITLLQLGSALRAALERVTRRRSDTWRIVWARRRDWRPGYPRARATIFGMPVEAVAA
ncbi:glycosyltransferase family 2 protein [Protaetiibacter larvae]|uniref:glycosyltransferase family 2 protein n=1 Tax=Protaetiibacter larvae TaxID=2592654 RepID=UPI001AEF86DA|nr:glycosyltransferase family 2 protein [Protaetiibacter larvae]